MKNTDIVKRRTLGDNPANLYGIVDSNTKEVLLPCAYDKVIEHNNSYVVTKDDVKIEIDVNSKSELIRDLKILHAAFKVVKNKNELKKLSDEIILGKDNLNRLYMQILSILESYVFSNKNKAEFKSKLLRARTLKNALINESIRREIRNERIKEENTLRVAENRNDFFAEMKNIKSLTIYQQRKMIEEAERKEL